MAWLGQPVDTPMPGWTARACLVDCQPVAVGMFNGPEVHLVVSPTWRGLAITRGRARAFLEPDLQEHGYLTTRSPSADLATDRFLSRVGFVKTWHDGEHQFWMLTAPPFSREN